MRTLLACFVCAGLVIVSAVYGQERDTDGDGLSDFQEMHKYGTDPTKFSTTGDGVSDGDWDRRREFAYTVRSLIKVMAPVNVDCLNDDYQDARVLTQRDNVFDLEVIHYPLNTVAESIQANPNWRKDAAALQEYVQPGLTTNWDEPMKIELIAALQKDGIDPEKLTDKELVERVTRWLLSQSKYSSMFCTHYIDFSTEQPRVLPGLQARFDIDKGDAGWTNQEQFEHELFGRSMFANRSHGSCTSTAVYLTTVLRALGIPTRMVLALPVVDPTDPAQIAMVKDNVHHHQVCRTILLGLSGAKGYANHTFNEVFVGGRWARLNYSKLGQNILDAHTFGLLTHVHSFNDLSEARLAETWGKRYALGERDDVFRFGNPYRADEISDHFGKFARIENPERKEHQVLTLTRAYWPTSADAPAAARDAKLTAQMDPKAAYVMAHIDEWFPDESYGQYRLFAQNASKDFSFRADGHADVRGRFMGTITNPPDTHELIVFIAPDDFAKMKPGVDYTLVPQNGDAKNSWSTRGVVSIAIGK